MNCKHLFPQLAKISLVSLLILVGIEATLKISFDCQLSGVKYDIDLGWRFKENYSGTIIKNLDSDEKVITKVNFNKDGFRDSNHNLIKAIDTKRIIILGDSYTAGTAISKDEIFSNIFQNKLNDKPNSEYKFEVMNVAVPAWSTDQHYIYLKQEGLSYKPDYIIIMITPNDIRESYGKRFLYIDNERKLVKRKLKPLPMVTRFFWYLSGKFCTFQAIQYMLDTNYGSFKNIDAYFPSTFHTGSQIFNDKHLFLKKETPEVINARVLFTKILSEIHSLSENNNIKLILSLIPTKMEFDGTLSNKQYDSRKITRFVSSIANQKEIPYMDLNSILKEQDDPLKIYISWEYHFNEDGHLFIANELIRFFNNNK